MLERFEKRFEGSQEVPDVVLVLGGTNDVLQNVPWPMMAMEPNATRFSVESKCACHSYGKGQQKQLLLFHQTSEVLKCTFWGCPCWNTSHTLESMSRRSKRAVQVPLETTLANLQAWI